MICPTEIPIFSGKFTIFSGKFTMFSSFNASDLGLVFMQATQTFDGCPGIIKNLTGPVIYRIFSDPLSTVIYPHENRYAHFC